MNNSENTSEQTTKRNNTTLWVMVFLFGLPYLAAFYFYFNSDEMELATTNYGAIISPARPVPDIKLLKIDGSDFKLSSLNGTWVLGAFGKSVCEKDCIDNLYKIRQIKKAVGQDFKRISKAFFLLDKEHIDSFKNLLNEYPGMDVIIPSGNEYENYLSTFRHDKIALEDSIFIIDPIGNYMMIYPKGANASKMLKDIERLLKVSKIG